MKTVTVIYFTLFSPTLCLSQPSTSAPKELENDDVCKFLSSDNQTFICQSDKLTDLQGTDIPCNLKTFVLNETGLESLSESLFAGHNITNIVISANHKLKTFHNRTFADAYNLQNLTITRNLHLEWPGPGSELFQAFAGAQKLQVLDLEANNITLKGLRTLIASQNLFHTEAILQELVILSLKKNPLQVLDATTFVPLRNSKIFHLNLQSCQLEFIHKDAFKPLSRLQSIELFFNPKLFQPGFDSCVPPITVSFSVFKVSSILHNLDIAKNSLTVIPTSTLSLVSGTLERLNLANNYLNFLGSTGTNQGNFTFPYLHSLQELILDNCYIRTIHSETFRNIPNLKFLSLQSNPLQVLPSAVLLPSLRFLSIGIHEDVEMEADHEYFSIPKDTFSQHPMEQLAVLEIHNANFGNLSDYHFSGLSQLEALSLRGSRFRYFNDNLFGNLSRLTNISLAYIKSEVPLELKHIQGPENLINLDLTYATLDLKSMQTSLVVDNKLPGEESEQVINPTFLLFKSLEVLNMTGTLFELDNPMEKLFLEYIENLTVLEVGENRLHSWNKTFFNNNANLKHLSIAKNGLDIMITDEMLTDVFQNTNLDTLDLSGNTFLCSSHVSSFFRLALNHTEMFIVDFHNGTGYSCIDNANNGTVVTFADYASGGTMINDGVDVSDDTNVKMVFGVGAGVGVLIISIVALIGYKKRWYIKYHYYWLIKKPVKREEPFDYDVFISYCQKNEAWVKSQLIPFLEAREPCLRVCHHERDFAPGKSIVENIVDSLDRSRKCLLILSDQYLASTWCMFETHLASNRLVQENRQSLVVVKLDDFEDSKLNKELKYLTSSLTYMTWPKAEYEEDSFWQKLKVTLMKKSTSYANVSMI